MDQAQWIRDSIQKLIEHHHLLHEIGEYPLSLFVTFLDAVERIDAAQRLKFVTDMSTIVGGMFGGGDEFSEHIEKLQDVTTGE